jgi:hypothetical protein
MRFTLFFAMILPLFAPVTPKAADLNGYTAEYECRAGGPHCNVDVTSYISQQCQQTITTADNESTMESKLNGASQYICIEPGDYTQKGTIDITTSGSSNAYKVFRYTRSGDTDDDPWKQSEQDRAKLLKLTINGNYWIIHRLTFPSYSGTNPDLRIESRGGKEFQIIDRVLVEGTGAGSNYYGYSQDCSAGRYSNITVQNSVFRNVGPYKKLWEAVAVDLQCGDNLRAVNNEIYDWVAHALQLGNNSGPINRNTVVENNDLYVSTALYTDCSGHYTTAGPCAGSEGPFSPKVAAIAGSETKIIHNRIWGARRTDLNLCCNGDGGQLMGQYEIGKYTLLLNNILMDGQTGVNNVADHNSYIGNIFYLIQKFNPDVPSIAINRWNSHEGASRYGLYLNSFIVAGGDYSLPALTDSNVDTKCNVMIDTGPKYTSGIPPTSSVADHNAFYGSPSFTFNGTNSNIKKSISTRTSSTKYTAGDVVRWEDVKNCSGFSDAACYLYMAKNNGKSQGQTPRPCITLGCSFDDGSITWHAIRGPYTFYRKLRTNPKLVVIPYAQLYSDPNDLASSAPEAYACPPSFASRPGIGVDDAN